MTPVLEKLERSIQRVSESGCWIWMLRTTKSGYGEMRHAGRTYLAHRLSYETLKAPIPTGLTIDHKCKVRCCVNPDHLETVTRAENTRRGDHRNKGQHFRDRTSCGRGHPYTEQNTYIKFITKAGKSYKTRVCKTCHHGSSATRRSVP